MVANINSISIKYQLVLYIVLFDKKNRMNLKATTKIIQLVYLYVDDVSHACAYTIHIYLFCRKLNV
jgi:hypothetical protein